MPVQVPPGGPTSKKKGSALAQMSVGLLPNTMGSVLAIVMSKVSVRSPQGLSATRVIVPDWVKVAQ